MKTNYIRAQKKSDTVGELYIYGDIVDTQWYDTDVTPSGVVAALKEIEGVTSINMYVNSPGGNVFAGIAIHNAIKRHSATVTAYVDGVAASIASVIIMAAEKIIIPENGMIMIHSPWTIAAGNADEMRKVADMLDKVREPIIKSYLSKVKLSEAEIVALLDSGDTWMTGAEAVEKGFADELETGREIDAKMIDGNPVFNGIKMDVSNYKSFPGVREKSAAAPAVTPQSSAVDMTGYDIKNKENKIKLMEAEA